MVSALTAVSRPIRLETLSMRSRGTPPASVAMLAPFGHSWNGWGEPRFVAPEHATTLPPELAPAEQPLRPENHEEHHQQRVDDHADAGKLLVERAQRFGEDGHDGGAQRGAADRADAAEHDHHDHFDRL